MLSLLRADLFKVRKGQTIWWLLAISLAIIILQITLTAALLPDKTNLAFPNSLLAINTQITGTVALMLLIFGAISIGSEYGHDTWKNLLTRQPGREVFIISKALMVLIIYILGLLILAAVTIGVGFILQSAMSLKGSGSTFSSGTALLLFVISGLTPLAYSYISIMGAVLGRSSVGGIVIGIVWLIVESIVSLIPFSADLVWIKFLSFSFILSNLQGNLVSGSAQFDLLSSLIATVLYLLAPIAIACFVFRQRDMLGAA